MCVHVLELADRRCDCDCVGCGKVRCGKAVVGGQGADVCQLDCPWLALRLTSVATRSPFGPGVLSRVCGESLSNGCPEGVWLREATGGCLKRRVSGLALCGWFLGGLLAGRCWLNECGKLSAKGHTLAGSCPYLEFIQVKCRVGQ